MPKGWFEFNEGKAKCNAEGAKLAEPQDQMEFNQIIQFLSERCFGDNEFLTGILEVGTNYR